MNLYAIASLNTCDLDIEQDIVLARDERSAILNSEIFAKGNEHWLESIPVKMEEIKKYFLESDFVIGVKLIPPAKIRNPNNA